MQKIQLETISGTVHAFIHEVTYLGHKCTDKEILPDDSKFDIKNYPKPKNSEEAKRFVSSVNYYRRFIRSFAEYARHLTKLGKVYLFGKVYNLHGQTTAKRPSTTYLKSSLIDPPLLKYADFEKAFVLTTDASKLACGAVLSQTYGVDQLPIAFASRAFTKGESNKSTIEQELAAIHWTITHFSPYIYGIQFLVKSDHRPLTYLFTMKNPSSKLTRMRLGLEEYDFTIEYIKGKENYIADALSHIDLRDIKQIAEAKTNIFKVTTRSQMKQIQNNAIKPDHTNTNIAVYFPKVYEAITIQKVRKMVCLKFYANKCVIRHRKTILGSIAANEYATNGDINLDLFFPRLEKEASSLKIRKIRISLNEDIFDKIRIKIFKEIREKLLKTLTIALSPKISTITNKKEKMNIIKRYHDDPAFGGHPGLLGYYKKSDVTIFGKA
ncbi:uncharacterized protein LOC118745701 isoform X1 [Rhagoletis pomonella]|uniref:uncharacterized protein LOC118745701 isoform X1 n=1 Tax=Rhagoletis pomonella TaxID=28610 RepID=UPI00177B94AD|nr:uncharacterized protein LOC118745701 isoform X1 [Rhagoletis pomonella]